MATPFYSVDTLEAPNSVGFLIKRCGGLLSQVAERRFASEQVSFTQWMVIAMLGRFEHLTATALSAQTCHDMGALTRIVDGLEAQGLVRRERSQSDRRVVEIALTPAGRKYLQAGKRLVVDLLNALVMPFSRGEVETLIGLLQRMMAHLQEVETVTRVPQPQEAARSRRGERQPTTLRRRPARRQRRARPQ